MAKLNRKKIAEIAMVLAPMGAGIALIKVAGFFQLIPVRVAPYLRLAGCVLWVGGALILAWNLAKIVDNLPPRKDSCF